MAAKIVLVLALAACTMADPGYFGYGYGYPAYGYRAYGYGRGVAAHPGGGSSYVARSPQGLGKRSADPEPEAEPGYGYYGYPAYGYGGYGYGGVASHYGGGNSYTYRSAQGLRGKRSAEAEPGYGYYGYPAYGYGYPAYGYGARSYVYRSPQGLSGYRGKRSAEPSYYGYGPSSYQNVQRPGSAYSVSTNGYAGRVYEDNFNGYNGAYGYGFTAYRGKRSAEPGYFGGSYTEVIRPYANSAYAVSTNGYGGRVYEDNYNGAAYGYGFRSAYGYY